MGKKVLWGMKWKCWFPFEVYIYIYIYTYIYIYIYIYVYIHVTWIQCIHPQSFEGCAIKEEKEEEEELAKITHLVLVNVYPT